MWSVQAPHALIGKDVGLGDEEREGASERRVFGKMKMSVCH